MSVDNLWIFSVSHDSVLKMYSLEEMQTMRSVNVKDQALSCCYPLPNNKTVLLGSKDNNLCTYRSVHPSTKTSLKKLYLKADSKFSSVCHYWTQPALKVGS